MLKWNLFQSADGAEREVFPKITCFTGKGIYIYFEMKAPVLFSKDVAPL